MTVAAFMDVALNHPQLGYYAGTAQRSGRAGDFFTSVDVGPLFGACLAAQLAEMAELLSGPFDLVEAAAGNGRLSADILRAARRNHPDFYDRIRLHLVETSPSAREVQRATLAEVADRLVTTSSRLPDAFTGALVANELLDALPVHQVVMRDEGLREVYVDVVDPQPGSESGAAGTGRLVTREGPLSTAELGRYLERLGVVLEAGWRVEIGLRAVTWARKAARALERGFLVLIDYGHEARELYSASHSAGTLTSYSRHTMAGPERAGGGPPWLQNPGGRDITAHVDFTSVRAALEGEGVETLGYLDQTYFLLGILGGRESLLLDDLEIMAGSQGDGTSVSQNGNDSRPPFSHRLAFKTLMMPGGLGSTHKVLLGAKGVGRPPLSGCSFRIRAT